MWAGTSPHMARVLPNPGQGCGTGTVSVPSLGGEMSLVGHRTHVEQATVQTGTPFLPVPCLCPPPPTPRLEVFSPVPAQPTSIHRETG